MHKYRVPSLSISNLGKYLTISIALCLAIIVSAFVIPKEERNAVFTILMHTKEIANTRNYIALLAEGDEANLRPICTKDIIIFTDPFYLNGYSKAVRDIDIHSLSLRGIYLQEELEQKVLFIWVGSNNMEKTVSFKLKLQSDKWLLDGIMIDLIDPRKMFKGVTWVKRFTDLAILKLGSLFL
jgi:hypothetical protein